MRGSFFGLNVAVSGLFAAQRNLDVINHNLNNASTTGYSRQYAVQQAASPIAMYDGTGMVGTGATVTAVRRFRDEFLDFKYWSEQKSYGEWNAKMEAMADLEVAFGEPSEDGKTGSGFTPIMNELYNSLQDLTKNPSDLSVRAAVLKKAVTLTQYFNGMGSRLEKLQADLNQRIDIKVKEVNTLASQIAQLNKQIYTAELDGNIANDLRDQRTVLVDKLSGIVNIQASEVVVGTLPNGMENKHFSVTISGKPLVDHYNVTELKTEKRKTDLSATPIIDERVNYEDIEGLYNIKWADGNEVEIRGGELRGYLDIRDGNEGSSSGPSGQKSPTYKGVPYYIGKLNDFVQKFAEVFDHGMSADPLVKDGHAEGVDLYGNTGTNFFTYKEGDQVLTTSEFNKPANGYSKLTAKNFSVSADVLGDIKKMVTASGANQAENTDILKKLIGYRHETSMFAEGSPEDFMKALVAGVGIDSQQSIRMYNNQKKMTYQIETSRISVSGVSIDEELTNMVKFQHSYNACAKMLTTMAEIYDTLINRTGV